MELENVWQTSDDGQLVRTQDDYGNVIVERVQEIEPPTLLAQQGVANGADPHRLEMLTGTQQRRGKAADSEAALNADPDALPLLMDSETAQQRRQRVEAAVRTNLAGAQPVPHSESTQPRDDLYDGHNPRMDRRHFQNPQAQRPQLRDAHDWVNVGPADGPFRCRPHEAAPASRRSAPLQDTWRGSATGRSKPVLGLHRLGADDARARGVGAVHGDRAAAAAHAPVNRAQPLANAAADRARGRFGAAAPCARRSRPRRSGGAQRTKARRHLAQGGAADGRRHLGDADSARAGGAPARRRAAGRGRDRADGAPRRSWAGRRRPFAPTELRQAVARSPSPPAAPPTPRATSPTAARRRRTPRRRWRAATPRGARPRPTLARSRGRASLPRRTARGLAADAYAERAARATGRRRAAPRRPSPPPASPPGLSSSAERAQA